MISLFTNTVLEANCSLFIKVSGVFDTNLLRIRNFPEATKTQAGLFNSEKCAELFRRTFTLRLLASRFRKL